MRGLKRELATITNQQWAVLISLLGLVNMVILGGIVWLLATESPGGFRRVLAQAPATRTPFPTFTTTPTGLPPATPVGTFVPTWTPTVTPTPAATDTPTVAPTPTFAPVRIVLTATPTPSPTPIFDYLGTMRQLTPCENAGKHHIFIKVADTNGNGIDGVNLKINKGIETFTTKTETKQNLRGELEPGHVDFAMFKGSYLVEVLDGLSQVIGPISPDIPLNELCPETGNGVANSLFHYSFEVVFTKVR
jgi:hypothetical protein